MPTARKATAKKTVAKKTTPAKVTEAPRDAVEAALKVYKTRVADQVKKYRDSGDLCDDEFHVIREELDLEEFLATPSEIMVKINGDATVTGDLSQTEINEIRMGEAIANWFAKQLEKGIELEYSLPLNRTLGQNTTKTVTLTFKEVEVDDYDFEHSTR